MEGRRRGAPGAGVLTQVTKAHAGDALARLVRDERPRVLATLVRVTGDLDRAEEAVQDAAVRALETWPRDGVPHNPRAWLLVAAKRRAIDRARREGRRDDKEAAAMWSWDLSHGATNSWPGTSRRAKPGPEASGPADEAPDKWAPDTSGPETSGPETSGPEKSGPDNDGADDLLRLFFTCCHPTLGLDAQVPLALRTLGGLTTAEIARGLLVPEATVAKRLTRAKQKIADAHIPYRVPSARELPERLTGVAATIYLIFNEGYAPAQGPQLVRVDLSAAAVRLARLLAELMPDDATALGLLSLVLLQTSRQGARTDDRGDPVLLADQDRGRWDGERIREGVALCARALRRSAAQPNRYAVQAAIAACHALAPSYATTSWEAVISWYDVLLSVEDSPVARLNRAVAVAERDGPAHGLALVDAIAGLENYPWWHATRAELLWRLHRVDEGCAAAARATALGMSGPQSQRLTDRANELGGKPGPTSSPAPLDAG